MILYTYDLSGWFAGTTEDEQHQRATRVAPPVAKGYSKPNWTGKEWELQNYEEWQTALIKVAPPTVQQMEDAVQAHLDGIAALAGYDNIYTACTYADEGAVPKFQIEGQQLRAWRSLVWAYCHTVLKNVQDKKREVPSISQLIAELPSAPVFL